MDFNKEWARTKTKAQFIKTFEKVYPKLDLGLEYDKIVPPKKKVEEITENNVDFDS